MHIEKSTSSKPRVPQNLGEARFSIGGAHLIQNILSGSCLFGQPTFFHISWYVSYYHRWLLCISMSLDHCWESGLFLVSECWHIGILVSIVMLSESLRFVWLLCSGNCWGTHTAVISSLLIKRREKNGSKSTYELDWHTNLSLLSPTATLHGGFL